MGVIFIVAMIVACLLNMTTIASLSELNALMPNTTGGLAQYTLAALGPFPTLISMVGGYLFCNVLSCGVEASIFAYALGEVIPLPIPTITYTIIVTVVLLIANLNGVDMFAKVQDAVTYLMIASMVIMGIIGALGLGTGEKVNQPMNMTTDIPTIVSMTAVAFWLFIGAEYVIPVFKRSQKRKTECSPWNVSGTWHHLCGPVHPCAGISQLHSVGGIGQFRSAAYALWRKSFGKRRKIVDGLCGSAGVDQQSEFRN